jgi:hypothetical protein
VSAVMARSTASRSEIDPVRALQHALYRSAKADPGRRFPALRDKVYRRDVLWRAWGAVLHLHGCPLTARRRPRARGSGRRPTARSKRPDFDAVTVTWSQYRQIGTVDACQTPRSLPAECERHSAVGAAAPEVAVACSASCGGRTMVTGQWACCTQLSPTEPRKVLAIAPRPR